MPRPQDALAFLIAPVANRVRAVVSRALLRLIDDAAGVQLLQLSALKGETMSRVPRYGHFGFSSLPPAGAELVIVCPGGARDQAVAVADEHGPSRPTGILVVGEAMLYSTGGARARVRADGSIELLAPAGVAVSDDLEAGGNLVAGGQVEDLNGTLDALRQAYNVHTHSDPQGGVTGPPSPTA